MTFLLRFNHRGRNVISALLVQVSRTRLRVVRSVCEEKKKKIDAFEGGKCVNKDDVPGECRKLKGNEARFRVISL
jgi:hypothetical protein